MNDKFLEKLDIIFEEPSINDDENYHVNKIKDLHGEKQWIVDTLHNKSPIDKISLKQRISHISSELEKYKKIPMLFMKGYDHFTNEWNKRNIERPHYLQTEEEE